MNAENLIDKRTDNLNKINIVAEGEYVIIPLERYNELIDTISLYQNGTMVSLVKSLNEPSEKVSPWVYVADAGNLY
jgi:hypothetical protein